MPVHRGDAASPRESDTDDETEDEGPIHFRGRAFSHSRQTTAHPPLKRTSISRLNGSPEGGPPRAPEGPVPFTRSRSPVVMRSTPVSGKANPQRNTSPAVFVNTMTAVQAPFTVFPSHLELHARLPIFPWSWTFCIETKKAGESFLIIGSLIYAISKFSDYQPAASSQLSLSLYNSWILTELQMLIAISLLYIMWTHSSISLGAAALKHQVTSPISISLSPSVLRPADGRSPRRNSSWDSSKKSDFAFLWMSVPKNYREASDDGILTGLLFGPLIGSALLYSSLTQLSSSSPILLPLTWRIEPPAKLSNSQEPYSVLEALVLSRYNLIDLSTLCSSILLFHACTSSWLETRYLKRRDVPEGERGSVPRSEGLRSWYYVLFTVVVSLSSFTTKIVLQKIGCGIWHHITLFEVILGALFYQFTLYICLRLAHRVFTLGELGLVCFGGTTLLMEFVNINISRIWPLTTPFIKTYRLPTPLLIFQMALVAGSLFSGFLLSPILVLSRHIAQRPVRRLRKPKDKLRQRRLLALGFYAGLFLIVVGLIGLWTRWCLGNRDPWLWVIFWLLEGRNKWSRPGLLVYWALLGSLSVAGWTRQLARSKKFRVWNTNGENLIVPGAVLTTSQPSTEPASTNSNGNSLPSPPILASGGSLATDLLDAADKHVPTLKLNARRKFFHALAVVMFTPGIALDPAFTHLCFSAAFALFTFAEYVRYFAIYPFGAVVHLFMNEFLDHKDSGTAILSHFYLLTGCAGSLWLETPSRLLQFTGILVLGIGDALASIVGKRIGLHRWTPTTSKTIEGSLAFALSIVACAWALRLCGFVDPFSTKRYLAMVAISAVLEAFSDQNDNLTLPLYLWSILVLAEA
ncbi:hypothetical protein EDD85DRAFT_928699 [Armillaria nabsnona]|nr:hypothetical protein EDD85DRAFT_928699 [Armillaria nabsnona]